MLEYGLKGSDFGYFHLLDEKFAGIFGGPIDDVPSYKNLTAPYLGHAVLGRILEYLVATTFGYWIRAYRFLEVLILIILNLSFYKMLKYSTKSSWLSLLGALFLTANAPGFEIYEQYSYFIERIPVIPIALVGFIFWVKSFEKRNLINYVLATGIYISAMLLGHYAIMLLPLFVFFTLFKKPKFSHFIARIAPILLVVVIIIQYSTAGPTTFESQGRRSLNTNPLQIFNNQEGIVRKVMVQLTSVLIPSEAIAIHERNSGKTFNEAFNEFIIPSMLAYAFLSLYILKICHPRLKVLYLTAQFSLLSTTLVNLYLDRVDFEAELGASRLYYIPHLFLSIVIPIIVYNLVKKRRLKSLKGLVIVFISMVLYLDIMSIHKTLNYYKTTYAGVIKTIDWASKESHVLPKWSIVYLPQALGTPPLFFFQQHFGNHLKFLSYDQLSEAIPDSNEDTNVYLLEFNENYKLEKVEGLEIVVTGVSKSPKIQK